MFKKDGKFYVIDKVGTYKLVEVVFVGEEDRPLYKIYKGKDMVKHWRSDEDLHDLGNDRYIAESDDYDEFVQYIEENSDEEFETDLGGLPTNSLLGTTKSPNYKKPKSYRYDPHGYDDDYSYGSYSGYHYTPKPEVVDEEKVKELTKSDTVVFHLNDPSTVMLEQIYQGRNFDVIRSRLNTPTTRAIMEAHERIICLGHGTTGGLIGMFGTEVRDCFRNKKIFTIWCNADGYFNAGHVGQGAFITGNMPSEVWECRAAGCGDISKELMLENITYWSKLCADKLEDCLAGNVRESVDYIRREYIKKYGDHPVTHYNAVRTFVLGDSYEQAEQEVRAIEDELGIHPDWDKYNSPKKVDDVPNTGSTGNKNLDDGLKMCLNKIKKELNTINGKNFFDLKSVSKADDSFYDYVGKLLIDRLKPIYPEYEFVLDGSVISWKEV